MRAIIQRVSSATIKINDNGIISEERIGQGIVLLLGIYSTDTEINLNRLAERCRGIRLFTDDNGKMTEPGTSEIAAKDSGVLIITKQLISNQNYSYDQKQEMEQQQQTTEAK